ncbi:ABC transporter substrate-binding protein [Microbacterium sp. NPDC091382]|uniref:ABC transporter substrate-binding protein n=1 Tax=Microbacterium sp. NPDC091382 TaxID=3364210 RepID=UPI003818DCF8
MDLHEESGLPGPELQKYDKVVYNFYVDERAMLNALKSGQIDAGYIAQKANVAEAEASDLSILTTRHDWQGLMMFDRAGDIIPELGDVRVRPAIMHAFDTDLMVNKAQLGFGKSNRQVFNEASTTYQPELNDDLSYNLDEAKALMSEAGWRRRAHD